MKDLQYSLLEFSKFWAILGNFHLMFYSWRAVSDKYFLFIGDYMCNYHIYLLDKVFSKRSTFNLPSLLYVMFQLYSIWL